MQNTGWGLLSRDTFSIIAQSLDGRDAAYCARVCTKWKHNVECTPLAMLLRRYHCIEVLDIAKLPKALEIQQGVSFKRGDMTAMFSTLLWYDHGINEQIFESMLNKCGIRNPNGFDMFNRILSCIKYFDGEGNDRWTDTAGNICTVSNFYWVNFCKRLDVLEKQYDVAGLEQLSAFFGGKFTWRLINFPFQGGDRYEINGHGFHRGTCIQFILKSKGRIDAPVYSTIKTLSKWKLPDLYVSPGRGKKRNYMEISEPEDIFPKEKSLVNLLKECGARKN